MGAPNVTSRRDATVLTFACDRPERVEVVARSRGHFRLRGEGALAGAFVDSVATGTWVSGLHATTEAGAVTFECRVDDAARGWRLERDTTQRLVRVTFASEGDSLEPFAVAPARTLRTVVLDPGHGGDDAGVTVADAREKDLALALAQRLALELQRRGVARVLLTRSDDHERTQEARAELANRAHADAVIALHFDEGAGRGAAAAMIWCAPMGSTGDAVASGAVALRPWRDAALDHAVASRELADRLAAAFEAASLGPARVRERLPYPLLGVQAPGVLFECGGLAVPETRARLLAEHGLDTIAAALADGVMAWARESR
jgi:N-acetylmuramoyl-L-alanine amidase